MRDFSIWQQCFIAALTGSAREPFLPEKDERYLVNRAESIANAATVRIEQLLKVHERSIGMPTLPPPKSRR
jgi:truncated hemoglobin YjbI